MQGAATDRVAKFLGILAKAMPTRGDNTAVCQGILEEFLKLLAESTQLDNNLFRARACQFIKLLLENMTCPVSDEVVEAVSEALVDRMKYDRVAKIRTLAVQGLAWLMQEPSEQVLHMKLADSNLHVAKQLMSTPCKAFAGCTSMVHAAR